MYNVNWNAPVNSAVIQLPDFVVMHVELLKFKTPLEGLQGFALVHRGTGVRMFEGVDIAYVVRKAVAEQNLMDHIRKDPELFNFALAGGRSAFQNNCLQCHGAGGAGSTGFPNLVDDDWIWGGNIEQIYTTIEHGIRNTDDKSRQSLMPRFGVDGVLTAPQVAAATDYVLSLSGRAKATPEGAKVWEEQCVACHKADGTGNQELGAPSLADGIWLYGGDRDSIYRTIFYARNGSMPAWGTRLDDATIKMLAIYVHALGGGR